MGVGVVWCGCDYCLYGLKVKIKQSYAIIVNKEPVLVANFDYS